MRDTRHSSKTISKKHVFSVFAILLFSPFFLTVVSALDTDGDGVDDYLDNCPLAYGNSTLDRDGCPDRDGDGTSDYNDRWTLPNTSFLEDTILSSNGDYLAVDHSPDGQFILTGDEDGWVRIWSLATKSNTLSAQMTYDGSGREVSDVKWSPDGTMIAATIDYGDILGIWYANNITQIDSISVDVGSNDNPANIAWSPDNSLLAIAIGRSGNGGTNGQVKIINVSTGSQTQSLNPNGEDRFYSVDWSPDGSRLAVGGNDDMWIYETVNWQINRSMTGTAASNINDIAWSPDGNYFATCEAWASSNSKAKMWNANTGVKVWEKTFSTSCMDADISPDGRLVAYGASWYQGDGASIKIFDVVGGGLKDVFSGPRPGGCTSGSNNQCGTVYGVSWHPDGQHLVSVHGRNDEGIYYWYADLDPDGDGYNSSDQGDGVVDAFPDDGTQWNDTDQDGYGDNPAPATEPDACFDVYGTSVFDRFGCPDSDGDGYSDPVSSLSGTGSWTVADGADAFIDDPEQWEDADMDGYGDNYLYDVEQSTEYHINQRGDAFPSNPNQWNDTDGDGWGDNFANSSWIEIRPALWPGILIPSATEVDTFPLDRYQWRDSDGDWVGDEPFSPRSDACPLLWGDSFEDRLGCPDSDGDAWSDPDGDWEAHPDGDADAFPNDPTQWRDTDGDGFGDNASGNNPDDCPGEAGNSWEDRHGCPDMDGDGWSNGGDAMPVDPTQWQDRDGDGYGDNLNGSNPDAFPDDATQWSDRDGDGYGDNPIGLSGDWFPDEPTQWHDFDTDGWGDNPDGLRGDACPEESGPKPKSSSDEGNPLTRGCPDQDLDGYPDPIDKFPENPFQWNDSDDDGWGDNQGSSDGDDCIDTPGTSSEANLQGCPDTDGDGWADTIDEFPNDSYQWKDTDGDGYGDNYLWENSTTELTDDGYGLRIEIGDAFPNEPTQWSNVDGDYRGDNPNGVQPDHFPLVYTQLFDTDGDGYGDNFTLGAFEPDDCSWAGTSYRDRFGCTDSDGDGQSDEYDACVWDPEIWEFNASGVTCGITEDPSLKDQNQDESTSSGSIVTDTNLYILGGVIAFLLLAVLIAQISKQAARRSGRMMVTDQAMEVMMADRALEEEARRQQWVDYYVQSGDFAKAKELGWQDPADLPQWKQHEMAQAAAADAAMPSMLDLDQL